MLARRRGYAYYEADCTMGMMNPFLRPSADSDEFQSMLEARPLKVTESGCTYDVCIIYNFLAPPDTIKST